MPEPEKTENSRTVVVTDVRYRSAIAAIRALGRAGWRVIAVQTRAESPLAPPAFSSRYVAECRWLEGSCKEAAYAGRLLALLGEYEQPVLLCIGAVTLNLVAGRRRDFAAVSRFLIAEPEVLDRANDKQQVHEMAEALGIPVPLEFHGEPDSYPVIVKPHCGEKAGLKAEQRYIRAEDPETFRAAVEKMRAYDPAPIVQQQVSGDGIGVSLLLDGEGRLLSALCHRRIREYPVTGGPSTCCESFYDAALVQRAYRLLQALRFTGMAMVEFKGACILEINPRIWGSFPMTDCAGSSFALRYAEAAAGSLHGPPESVCDYRAGVRMRFLLNDTLAGLAYLKRGDLRRGLGGLFGLPVAKEALWNREDPAPFFRYLRVNLLRR